MSRKGDDPMDRDESAEQETKNKAAKHPAFRAQSPPARLSIYQVGKSGGTKMTRIKVTTENIEEVREMVLASDMASEVAVGQEIETWPITYEGGQRGQMTVYHPAERAAIFTGGLSVWGDWDEDTRTLRDEDGAEYDENGEPVEVDDEGEGEGDGDE